MSLLSRLFGSDNKRQECVLVALDDYDNEMMPHEVLFPSDVSGVRFTFDGSARDVEVRRTFGQWHCSSCESCRHAQ